MSFGSGTVCRLALAGIAVAMAGCGPGPSLPAETVLTVWGTTIGPDDKGQADVVREFERRHPGVRVLTLGMGAGGMNPQKLMTAIVGGTPPDVVYQDRFTVADWAARGAFEPLDPLVERDRLHDPRTPTPDDYFPAPWREASFEGRLYGVPWMADNRALYWNRAVFRERAGDLRRAGLDPERAPRTWFELLAYSRVLTERAPDGRLVRAGFVPLYGNSFFVLFALQAGAQVIGPDGRTATLDSPQAERALEFLKDAYAIVGGVEEAGRFAASFAGQADDPFIKGRVAMKLDGDWSLRGLARFAPDLDFGVAPPPGPEGPSVTWTGGFAYCIPRGARHRDLAWEFVKFVTSEEGRLLEFRGQDELNRARGQASFPRVSAHRGFNEAALAEALPRRPSFAAAVRQHMALMVVAEPRPVSVASRAVWDEQARALDRTLRGLATPRQALAEADRQVQAQLDAHYRQEAFPVADLRVPAVLGLFGLALGAALFAARFRRARLGPVARTEAGWGVLFVAPWVLGFVAFTAGPMLASLILSFTQYNGLQPPRWVGTGNYEALFGLEGGLTARAFGNALYLTGVGVPLGLVTGLSVALLLDGRARGLLAYRAVATFPTIVPAVATAVLWVWILNPDPAQGLVNGVWGATVGEWFRVPPPGWFQSEDWAKPGLVLLGLWGAGGGAFLWLAGLRGVPKELYEAAALDGARPWAQFAAVTLPMLSPLVFFNAVTGVIAALQTFDAPYVVTGGVGSGPNDALAFPVNRLVQSGFADFRMGHASALAWTLFVVVLAATAVQMLVGRRWVYDEAGP